MSLVSQLQAGFTRVAEEINTLRSEMGTALGVTSKVWSSGATPNYVDDPIEIWSGTEDPIADGETPAEGDLWLDPTDTGAMPHGAGDITITNSGLILLGGVSNVQAALAAIDAELGEGDLAYSQFTSSSTPTPTSEATAVALVTAAALTLDGSTRIEVEFYVPFARPPTAQGELLNFWLYDGSTSLGRIGAIGTPANSSNYVPVHVSRFLTPSAGSHTYSIRASVSSGTTATVGVGVGGTGADMPGYIRVKRARA